MKPRRPEWGLARWIGRHPIALAWCFVIAVPCSLLWSEIVLFDNEIQVPVEWDMHLAARAAMDIKDLLDVIGHGVTIASVDAGNFESDAAAFYYIPERRVFVNSKNDLSDDTLLMLIGHEVAHAVFLQGGFFDEDPDIEAYQDAVHEVAADVLGAHLAGRVVSVRGGDGLAMTINLVEETRIMSRWFPRDPAALKGRIVTGWDGHVRTYVGNGYFLDPNCGAELLIDSANRICSDHDDLWEAARQIANELHNVDQETAWEMAPSDDWRPRRRD
jgi:hypothetical protein